MMHRHALMRLSPWLSTQNSKKKFFKTLQLTEKIFFFFQAPIFQFEKKTNSKRFCFFLVEGERNFFPVFFFFSATAAGEFMLSCIDSSDVDFGSDDINIVIDCSDEAKDFADVCTDLSSLDFAIDFCYSS